MSKKIKYITLAVCSIIVI